MKRGVKIVIAVVVMVLSIGLMGGTVFLSKKNGFPGDRPNSIPNLQEGSMNQDTDTTQDESGNQDTTQSKEDSTNKNDATTSDDSTNQEDSTNKDETLTPPQGEEKGTPPSGDDKTTPPEKPSGDEGNQGGNGFTPPQGEMPGNGGSFPGAKLGGMYLILFAVFSGAFSFSTLYLIFSGCGKHKVFGKGKLVNSPKSSKSTALLLCTNAARCWLSDVK